MRLWMGKEERVIDDECVKAGGGIDAQRDRMYETLRALPSDSQVRISDLVLEVFLAKPKEIPWNSPLRTDALEQLKQMAGGYPHAYAALIEYWPIAKSARMNDWS